MANENARETKPVEKLTDEALEQVTGGKVIYAKKKDYAYCSHCKDYTKNMTVEGKMVCARCKQPK